MEKWNATIWTRVTDSINYDNNHYAKSATHLCMDGWMDGLDTELCWYQNLWSMKLSALPRNHISYLRGVVGNTLDCERVRGFEPHSHNYISFGSLV